MPLSELIIDGFKSFAQKTKIHFDQGITAIVGPNGSGKSNITEAIRFAMGESRSKAMRGSNLADLIFAGSEGRKALNRAEVTLVFDNRQGEIAMNSDQVAVTRRIFRDGTNDYFINGRHVRLKDVRALFLDSGLAENSLAIISQGRVDQILNSKPEQRRGIFEEAAGVLHFKEQKQSAQSQVEKTQENLIRLNDLVQELQKRIKPLAEQSSLAKEYQFEKKGLDQDRKSLLAFQIQKLNEQKEKFMGQVKNGDSLLAKLDQEVKESQAAADAKHKHYRQLRQKREETQSKLLKLTADLADLKTKRQIAEQSSHFDQATRSEYNAQINEENEAISQSEKQLAQLQRETEQEQKRQSKLRSKQEKLRAQLQEDPAQLEKKLEDQRSAYIDLLQRQTANNNHFLYLTTEKKRLLALSADQTTNSKEELQKALSLLKAEQKKGQDLAKQRQKLQTARKALTAEIEVLAQKVNRLRAQTADQQTQLQKLTARREALQNIQQRHEGYYYGVRNVLNHRDHFPGLIGVIGELLAFPVKLEAAMTTALGSGVQDLVTSSRESARQAINQLKKAHAGRATFLPLNGLHSYPVPSSTITTLKTITGFQGIASQLVTSKAKENIQPAIDYLLGRVIIVDKIETALTISRMIHRYRIVTLDGDIIAPGGSMTGGTRNLRSNSPLQINAEINALTAKIDQKETLFQQRQAIVEGKEAQLKDKQKKGQKLAQQLQESNGQVNRAALDYQNQAKETSRLRQAYLLFSKQQKQRQQELKTLEEQLGQSQQQQTILAEQGQKAKSQIAATQAKIKNFAESNQAMQKKLNQLAAQIAVASNQVKNTQRQEREERERLHERQQQAQKLQQKLAEIGQSHHLSEQKKKLMSAKSKQLHEEHDRTEKQLNQIAADLGQVDAQISQLDQIARRNYDLRKDAASQREDLSVKVANLSSKMDQKLKALSQDYSLTYEAALAQAKVKNTAQERANLAKKVKLHQMSLADIGPVNLQAIAEYGQVKQRYDFLHQQQDDLLKARSDLQKSMTALDQEVAKRFAHTFKKIGQSFATIFPLMFNGGHARLMLTEPNDLLHTGVEIIAQPPGKKLQRLSLLSGGERALTAITLLFAMLKVNPVPFCILDEVEASLDDVNVSRFAQFLHRYEQATQFIVITHRRGTMEQADQLFGVVMQESGVSSILSVSLKDVKNEVN